MENVKLFIASSTEAIRLAKSIESYFKKLDGIDVVGWWDEDVFGVSRTFIEALEQIVESATAGIFVVTPDDKTLIRGSHKLTVRGNVIFEAGLFMGRHGRERIAMIGPRADLPTDLKGVTTILVSDKSENLSAQTKKKLDSWIKSLTPNTPNEIIHDFARKSFFEIRNVLFPLESIDKNVKKTVNINIPHSSYFAFLTKLVHLKELRALSAVEAIHDGVISLFKAHEAGGVSRKWFRIEAKKYHWLLDDEHGGDYERSLVTKTMLQSQKISRRFLLPPIESIPKSLMRSLIRYAETASTYSDSKVWFRIAENTPDIDENVLYIAIGEQNYMGKRLIGNRGVFVEIMSYNSKIPVFQHENSDLDPIKFIEEYKL
ncbi:MAG: nucleotide-binding protein [Pseudomonadota bacterium]|nr:nucleotide-binding protein [Pseudomonadota bacterium]